MTQPITPVLQESDSILRPDSEKIMIALLEFMLMFLVETIAKRILCLVLIAANVPNNNIVELTGLSEKSIRAYRKMVKAGSINQLFIIRSSGRKGKLHDIE